jgi:hypothetical protein
VNLAAVEHFLIVLLDIKRQQTVVNQQDKVWVATREINWRQVCMATQLVVGLLKYILPYIF